MPDPYANFADGFDTPYTHAFVITPSDGTPLAQVPRAVWVGGSGNLAVRLLNDAAGSVVLVGVTAVNGFLNIRPLYVMATGTTATLIVGFY